MKGQATDLDYLRPKVIEQATELGSLRTESEVLRERIRVLENQHSSEHTIP